jgi:hypothetical protein
MWVRRQHSEQNRLLTGDNARNPSVCGLEFGNEITRFCAMDVRLCRKQVGPVSEESDRRISAPSLNHSVEGLLSCSFGKTDPRILDSTSGSQLLGALRYRV